MKDKGCWQYVILGIIVLFATTFIVNYVTGYDFNDDMTDEIDGWSEFFAALLFFPVAYLILRFLGVIKNK